MVIDMLYNYYVKITGIVLVCIMFFFTSCSAAEEAVIDLTAEHIVLDNEIPSHLIQDDTYDEEIITNKPKALEADKIKKAENEEAHNEKTEIKETEIKETEIKETGNEEAIETAYQGSFTKHEISDDIFLRIQNKSYGEACDIPLSELSYIRVLHYGFDGEVHVGELIVNKKIEDDIIEIFKELFEERYPIERMVLIDEYNADDNLSMKDNNTSCFNYRVIQGSSALSNHAYGMAVDINPYYNPYVRIKGSIQTVLPDNALEYTDRELDCEYYIKKDDVCYNAFIKRGFTWGGDWESLKDYQHFEK